ncbi:hypothetical protein [Candidatus Viadribacter manganicus]|uniref:HTH marR-type domain-containing protein n=1 Tax=Candidatus Viadribacter manganicus TaxID=1759059 RepID=A0A1B1AGL1_9PROT|nr:hypothetical protein [Candidatus Viadribacter manganicus]ANP45699.1 hypothetical protein ATE48_07095 [Candidatus Viadribacter manganicus]
MSEDQLPDHVRPRAYAANELLLDMLWTLRSRVPDIDLEAVLIFLIVNEATMRPLMAGAQQRPHLLNDPRPPNEVRGRISRHAIADKSSLARETVRRKVNELLRRGLLIELRDGEVQSAFKFDDPNFQQIGDECFDAVGRYYERLGDFGQSQSAEPSGVRQG